jgi:hypothetical protein
MNNQNGSLFNSPLFWIVVIIGVMWVSNDGLTGLAVARNVSATNGMASQVSGLSQTVATSNDNVLAELAKLGSGQTAIVQTLDQQNKAITQQGDLLTGLFDAVGGLTTNVNGINDRLDVYDGRLMQLETAAQNAGLFSANNGAAPTPVTPLTQ